MHFAIDKFVFENKMRNWRTGEMTRRWVSRKTLASTITEVLSDL
jgi:hypothetical protein